LGINDSSIVLRPIGIIRTEHTVKEKTPIQPAYAMDSYGEAILFPEFSAGLKDLEGFSHIYLLFHLHQAKGMKLEVKPFLQNVLRGLFATRAPCRPNPIGLSIVELIKIEGNSLYFRGADMLDGSPLLDIKPYSAKFDSIASTRNGWQDDVSAEYAEKYGRRGYRPKGGI
jgi:tRNA-Thr(GGU) m(6)t(6)A37 methyltransferase TsaA